MNHSEIEQESSFQYDEDYFNKIYSTGFYRKYIEIVRNRFIKRQVEQYHKSGNFLEIGFGDDNLLQFFRNNFNIFGADISDFAITNNIKLYNKPENFKLCDISQEKIPFRQKFDVICAINTVEHLANPKFAIQNICNSLKPCGILVIQLPIQSNLFSRIQYRIFYDVPEHIFRPSVKTLTELFSEIGFKKLEQYIPTFLPLKIGNQFLIESFSLYFAILKKQKFSFR